MKMETREVVDMKLFRNWLSSLKAKQHLAGSSEKVKDPAEAIVQRQWSRGNATHNEFLESRKSPSQPNFTRIESRDGGARIRHAWKPVGQLRTDTPTSSDDADAQQGIDPYNTARIRTEKSR
jgi:hypothetical protein